MSTLQGKRVIITGAARGQGLTEAELFIQRGAQVVLTDLLVDDGRAAAERLGPAATFVEHDVSDEDSWAEVVRTAVDTLGGVDTLVNNAGVLRMEPLEQTTIGTFDLIQRVNVRGPYLGMLATLPHLKAAGNASIVNVSSLAGIQGQAFATAYSASKWAVRGMTKSAALELGQYGIRVNSVHPGTIWTPMVAAMVGDPDQPFPTVAMNRIGRVDDVAAAVAYLISDEAAYVTGSELVVDGGASAGEAAQFTALLQQGRTGPGA